MTSNWLEIPVEEIKNGDRFIDGGRHHWTAVEDAKVATDLGFDKVVTVRVQFSADRGLAVRAWDPGVILGIERDEVTA